MTAQLTMSRHGQRVSSKKLADGTVSMGHATISPQGEMFSVTLAVRDAAFTPIFYTLRLDRGEAKRLVDYLAKELKNVPVDNR